MSQPPKVSASPSPNAPESGGISKVDAIRDVVAAVSAAAAQAVPEESRFGPQLKQLLSGLGDNLDGSAVWNEVEAGRLNAGGILDALARDVMAHVWDTAGAELSKRPAQTVQVQDKTFVGGPRAGLSAAGGRLGAILHHVGLDPNNFAASVGRALDEVLAKNGKAVGTGVYREPENETDLKNTLYALALAAAKEGVNILAGAPVGVPTAAAATGAAGEVADGVEASSGNRYSGAPSAPSASPASTGGPSLLQLQTQATTERNALRDRPGLLNLARFLADAGGVAAAAAGRPEISAVLSAAKGVLDLAGGQGTPSFETLAEALGVTNPSALSLAAVADQTVGEAFLRKLREKLGGANDDAAPADPGLAQSVGQQLRDVLPADLGTRRAQRTARGAEFRPDWLTNRATHPGLRGLDAAALKAMKFDQKQDSLAVIDAALAHLQTQADGPEAAQALAVEFQALLGALDGLQRHPPEEVDVGPIKKMLVAAVNDGALSLLTAVAEGQSPSEVEAAVAGGLRAAAAQVAETIGDSGADSLFSALSSLYGPNLSPAQLAQAQAAAKQNPAPAHPGGTGSGTPANGGPANGTQAGGTPNAAPTNGGATNGTPANGGPAGGTAPGLSRLNDPSQDWMQGLWNHHQGGDLTLDQQRFLACASILNDPSLCFEDKIFMFFLTHGEFMRRMAKRELEIYNELERELAKAAFDRETTEKERATLAAEGQQIDADPTLTDAEKDRQLKPINDEIEAYDLQLKQGQARLDELKRDVGAAEKRAQKQMQRADEMLNLAMSYADKNQMRMYQLTSRM